MTTHPLARTFSVLRGLHLCFEGPASPSTSIHIAPTRKEAILSFHPPYGTIAKSHACIPLTPIKHLLIIKMHRYKSNYLHIITIECANEREIRENWTVSTILAPLHGETREASSSPVLYMKGFERISPTGTIEYSSLQWRPNCSNNSFSAQNRVIHVSQSIGIPLTHQYSRCCPCHSGNWGLLL